MKTNRRFVNSRTVGALGAVVALLTGGVAYGNTVTSNQPDCNGVMNTRTFSVTADTVVKCLLKGTGNLNGSGDAINALGYVTLDKSDATSGFPFIDALTGGGGSNADLTTGVSGTFTISSSVFSSYDNIVIALKSGNNTDPTWASFLLADNTLTGSWVIDPGQNISHALLYGKLKSGGGGGGGGAPEPASIALLGLGLLGMVAARRRRA